MKLSEIAEKLGCQLVGDGAVEILRVRGIDQATRGDLAFIANRKYLAHLKGTKASAVILGLEHPETPLPNLRSVNPYLTFAKAIELFYQAPLPPRGIDPTAVISPRAVIGKNPSVGAYVVIGDDVHIGDNVTLYPHVCIYTGVRMGNGCVVHAQTVLREFVQIGDRVIFQNGVIIGGDGFGFAKQDDDTLYKIVQSGTVIIEDDVEIGSHSTVDRATIGATVIKRGAKIDNLVQIGHGSTVGEHNLLAAQVGLAGSTVLESHVTLAGQVGCAGHLTIREHAVVTAQSGVGGNIDAHAIVSGSPTMDNLVWRKVIAGLPRLPDLLRRVRQLEVEIKAIKTHRTPDTVTDQKDEERNNA
ncbi:MAG: UDP-3-O-(3-hydroxymyristoyl)glucosamine N-acyltransferase [Acidobacteria bacterium]|nr:UDP-3-O-(3-hydroxymyristoyl)glucosamine N-acyltransferase [Acidobacteriota bacterium]MBI3656698.1 UDP-3-O-(3-hydroxymyristoyl)glucosamine N-acyltransferase [Acidobacteriota bacterium]